MKFQVLISLVVSAGILPFAANAQDYDVQGYSEADYAALLGNTGGVGFKNPLFKGQYYAFGKYLGAELGNGNDTALSTPYAFSSSNRNLLGVGTLPIGEKFSLFGRFGVARSSSDSGPNLNVPYFLGARNSDLKYGIGLKYNYSSNLDMRFGWDRYNSMGLDDPYNSQIQNEVHWFSLGFGLKF